MNVLRYNTIWISDVHLGLKCSRAEFLLDFLKHTESDHLYLVGDMIDFWCMKRTAYWSPLHSQVIQAVLDKAARGTRVIYVPGNHDEIFRDYTGTLFGGVQIVSDAVHCTADGRRFLVLHGDEFDGVVKHSRWLAVLGSHAYDRLLTLNRWFNLARRRLGFPYWSLSAYLKHKVKNAVRFITDFEAAVVREARKRHFDGVICGHIHRAQIEMRDGILYCNDGDWVESCTALVERKDGSLAVIHWADESVLLLCEESDEHCHRDRCLVSAD
ncbi:MAG: UDP-2,3-diacylglucosamine diphosphatase [Pseudomonadota bacterium]|nr:UDP-2,3-diacylglucosamine diphosphatase [Pseudomonadota bacterium]